MPDLAEFLISAAALAAAVSVRPWRMLAPGARYDLLQPLLVLGIALPLAWWCAPTNAAPITKLLGSQIALLTLGWPLAVLLFGCAGLAGVLAGDASVADALGTFVWAGVVPATLGLAAGHLMRVWGKSNPLSYLLGRAFIVALFATFAAALVAQCLFDRYEGMGSAVAPALFLVSLLDAMLTGSCLTLLIVLCPRCVATWSDRLYFGQREAHARALHRTRP